MSPAAERTVVVHEDLNPEADTDTLAGPANGHSRSARVARGGCVPGSAHADGPIQLDPHQPETAVALL